MRLAQGVSLQILLAGAATTVEGYCVATWKDSDKCETTTKRSNGATAVTIVPASATPGIMREVISVTYYNADSAQQVVTFQAVGGTVTPAIVTKIAAEIGDTIQYSQSGGWMKTTSAGIWATTATTDSSTADSKAVSAGVRASVADSKSVSSSTVDSGSTSSAVSRDTSQSTLISAADSKGVSASGNASQATSAAGSVSLNTSTAQSTATSGGTAASGALSAATSVSVLDSSNTSRDTSQSVLISALTSRVSSKGG